MGWRRERWPKDPLGNFLRQLLKEGAAYCLTHALCEGGQGIVSTYLLDKGCGIGHDGYMHKLILVVGFILLFIALLFAATVYFEGYIGGFDGKLESFMSEHSVTGIFVFMALAAASVMLGPFSSSPLVPLAITVWGVIPASFFLIAGWMIGDTLAYAIGRYAGLPFVERLAGEHSILRWKSILEPHMTFPFLLLFRLATPAETGYAFGLLKYKFKLYMALTVIAELPAAIIVVFAGKAFNGEYWWLVGVYALAAILLFLIAYRVLARRIKNFVETIS
ncbi:MAG: TVP38/TMEM64 family protein [Candidatus Sungbacteria bacterium]|nr:TVP38/TMEM64 family protein [Candidatus Sungbacteria bacterium]